MEDRWVVALTVCVVVGAVVSRPVPVALVVGAGMVAVAGRHPVGWCVAAGLLASLLGARAWAGLDPPPPGPVSGPVTVLTDPVRVGPAVRAIVRVDGRRVEAWARGPGAAALARRSAGDVVVVEGRVGPASPAKRERLARRHVVGALSVTRVGPWAEGGPVWRSANRLRAVLHRGAQSLPDGQRALLAGIVVGDDRAVPAGTVDAMRAAGLGHLTAVSGQNVAFVLLIAAPVLTRLRPGPRWVTTLGLLGWFCLLTRFEPSVLRAAAMAGVGVTATVLGRPASSLRLLALAVAGLVLADPLLVWSVGFALSAGATLGLVTLSGPIGRLLPGPRPVAAALATTLAAQVGVAPVSLLVFGGLPPVALVANLLAVPVAGPLMMWGLTGGVLAGALPAPLAAVLHVPTRVMLGWIEAVAVGAARVPGGQLGGWSLVALTVAAGLAAAARRTHRRAPAVGAAVVALGALVAPLVAPSLPAADGLAQRGARVWVAADGPGRRATVVVLDRGSAATLDALRRARVPAADVLVVTTTDPATEEVARTLIRRGAARLVLAPPGSLVPGAQPPAPGTLVRAGPLVVEVVEVTDRRLTVGISGPSG